MKLLHIVATPRADLSNTMQISNVFLEALQLKYDHLNIKLLNLFDYDLPSVAGENIEVKYNLMKGLRIDKAHEESWKEIEFLIANFLRADVYLITSPMWNFSIPYVLKYYIDCIVQPGYLFRFNEIGQAVGMISGKKMVCVTSRGGDYSEQSPLHVFDFQEPYLRSIFGLCGISDIQFINAQPLDITPEIRAHALQKAFLQAQTLAANFDWSPGVDVAGTV